MLKKIVNLLPEWVKEGLRQVKKFILSILFYGRGRRCPVCGHEYSKFRKAGVPPREDAVCINCGAMERNRFAWIYINKKTNLFSESPKRMLHVAPEKCFESRFRKYLGDNYITADLLDPRVMLKMDITDIQYQDEYFDVIYCSHVLEHVPDDRKAMREFYRVLKQNGWAILLVPVDAEKTFEDPTIVDPSERLRIFGQSDHVRIYGHDFADRLREAGFKVNVSSVPDICGKDDIVLMGLTPACGEIYYCTKV
ncbi:MAG: methyltransferase domain-containing protein [Ignavibacteriaceae bacterium]|nr:methyltransferase domain-containing protein [Ignavibacteriaceae bacterium]